MNLLQQFKQHINSQKLFHPADKLIIAVSGGIDSVVLCELCNQAGFDFMIAHCNFKLRGEESERDERFVRQLAAGYNVKFELKKFDTGEYAGKRKISIQEAARELRYQWFEELINSNARPGSSYLLTAHHADDTIETLLMHFFRGTGLPGLTGIPANAGYTRRPLLPFTKEALVTFAREQKLQWVEDSSNANSDYTRNYLRNELIPGLQKVFPQVKENLRSNIDRFKDIRSFYEHAVSEAKKRLIKEKGKEKQIPVRLLKRSENKGLIYEIIKDFGFSAHQVKDTLALLESDNGKFISSHSHRIIRNRNWLIITSNEVGQAETILIEEKDTTVPFMLGKLAISKNTKHNPPTDHKTALLDLADISFPLLLRPWKPGDYFYPLGMKRKKKKVARFLIDLKLSKPEKEKVWVLESNYRILWLVGYRIDDRFKITEKTTSVLDVKWSG